MREKFSAIILAGGNGKRFGKKKQFMLLDGGPIWQVLFKKACGLFDDIVVVGVDCEAGETRRESVRNGLRRIKGDYVIILESARPLVSIEQIKLLKRAVVKYRNATFYKPIVNTVYDGFGFARKGIFEILTPQGFEVKLLKEALREHRALLATDECQTVCRITKKPPFFLDGDFRMYKITYPEDLQIVRSLNSCIKKCGGKL